MSGRRSLIKGYFWRCAGRGCDHVFGLSRGRLDPLALMLSADPLPRSEQRAWCADNATGFGINPLSCASIGFRTSHCASACRFLDTTADSPFRKRIVFFLLSTSAPLGSPRITLSKPVTLHVHKRPRLSVRFAWQSWSVRRTDRPRSAPRLGDLCRESLSANITFECIAFAA
jgi:hypothetical protein